MIVRKKKYPAEVRRVGLDYSQWLDSGEQITAINVSTNAQAGSTFTANQASIGPTGQLAIFFASGGTAGEKVTCYVTITTNVNQVKEDEVVFTIKAA